MVRIIPWNLPPVKGGSIGGYTPDSGGSDPTPVVQYVDFSNAVISYENNPNEVALKIPYTMMDPGASATVSGAVNTTITGMIINSLVGVASISCILEVQSKVNEFRVDDNTATLILEPATLNITGATGKVTNIGNYSQTRGSIPSTVSKLTFVVYNGNGEILQTEEITPGA